MTRAPSRLPNKLLTHGLRQWGVPEKVSSEVSALPWPQKPDLGASWGVKPLKSRMEQMRSWSYEGIKETGVFGGFGSALMFVLGFGAGSHSLKGCFPLGVLCAWAMG